MIDCWMFTRASCVVLSGRKGLPAAKSTLFSLGGQNRPEQSAGS
jgi:hypothetical protein